MGLEFLNRLFDWIFQFIPQFEILGPDENAVRITCIPFIHKWHRTKTYGWYAWWPLFQTWTSLNVKPQILKVNVSRTRKDGSTTESSWAVQYWSQNIYKTCFEVEEHEERLACHVVKVLGDRIENGESLEGVLKEIRSGVEGFGLYIQDVLKMDDVVVEPIKIYHEVAGLTKGRVYSAYSE